VVQVAPEDDTAPLGGCETVLVVDDEEMLLSMVKTVLSAYGYNVLTVGTGLKALEILSKKEEPVDLLITDLVMPAMSGRELVEQVRRLAPEVRILCISGYVYPNSPEKDGIFLRKPFSTPELLQKVRLALSGPKGNPA
jgi:two-component system, cell cycle sensor histidine kinase and response regulator CckA